MSSQKSKPSRSNWRPFLYPLIATLWGFGGARQLKCNRVAFERPPRVCQKMEIDLAGAPHVEARTLRNTNRHRPGKVHLKIEINTSFIFEVLQSG